MLVPRKGACMKTTNITVRVNGIQVFADFEENEVFVETNRICPEQIPSLINALRRVFDKFENNRR